MNRFTTAHAIVLASIILGASIVAAALLAPGRYEFVPNGERRFNTVTGTVADCDYRGSRVDETRVLHCVEVPMR